MKNIVLLFCFLMISGMAMGQALKVAANGNIGVGTGNPEDELHLQKDEAGPVTFKVENTNAALNAHSLFVMKTASGAGNSRMQWVSPGRGTWYMGLDNQDEGRMKFVWNNSSLSSNQRFVIKTSGDIGIGTSNPDAKLSVNGDASKTGSSTWSTFSDRRLKSNVNDYTDGLHEVLQIRPVTFKYNGQLGLSTDQEFVGIIAQEMQKVAPYMISEAISKDMVLDKSGEENSIKETKMGYLKYDANALPYMLVNAIKEQQELIEELQNQIADLSEAVALSSQEVINTPVELSDITLNELNQNQPNPYNDHTVISYSVASSSKAASMKFYNMNGQLIKTVALQSGDGKVTVSSDELPAGTYTYSLEVDGQLVSNRKMVKMR